MNGGPDRCDPWADRLTWEREISMIRRQLALAAGLALVLSASLAATGLAQTLAAQSGRIIELTRAGKYSDALPLALVMVASLEKSNNTRHLAGALNNLGQVYAGQGHDEQAEPPYKRAIALTEKFARP